MFAFKAAVVVLILFAVAVLRDRRSFANAVLLGLTLALVALGTAEWLARAHDPAARLVLLAVFLLVAAGPVIVAVYLVANGVTMVSREGLRPTSLLPLLAGGGILAVIAFELATPLAGSDELACRPRSSCCCPATSRSSACRSCCTPSSTAACACPATPTSSWCSAPGCWMAARSRRCWPAC